jgi:hypothetical protein
MRSAGLVLQKWKFDKFLCKIRLTQYMKYNQTFALPNFGPKAVSYTAVALSLLTWRIWWAARNASNFRVYYLVSGDRGSTVVKVLCYISECHWFDPRWCHSNLSLTLNPSVRTMALRSTQPLTEISTRSISVGDKRGRCVRLKTLTQSCAVGMKSGNRNFLEPSGPLQACKGTVLPLLGFTFSWLVSLTVHAASEILALSVILCEVLSMVCAAAVAYPGILFGRGSTNSFADRG